MSVWQLPVCAQPTTLPGTSISVDVPQGFEVSSQFTGLHDLDTGASFLFTELPVQANSQTSDMFQNLENAAAVFMSQGITLREEIVLDTNQTDFPAFYGTQSVGNVDFVKWISLFTNEGALIVSYQSPPPGDAEALIAGTLESIRIGTPVTTSEKISTLPFKIGPTGDMRIVDTMAGSVVLLTIGDQDIDTSGDQPILIVASSLGDVLVGDENLSAYSKLLLNQVANLTVEHLIDEAGIAVAGWPGIRLEVLGIDTPSGRRMRVVQWVGYSDEGYIRVIAQSPEETWHSAIHHFETVVAGLETWD